MYWKGCGRSDGLLSGTIPAFPGKTEKTMKTCRYKWCPGHDWNHASPEYKSGMSHLSQLAWQDNIEVDLKKDLDWIELVECKVQWQDFVNPVMNLQVTWMQGISWPGKHLRTFKDPASCNWIAFTKLTGEFNPLTLISTKSLPWIILNDIPLYENFYLLH